MRVLRRKLLTFCLAGNRNHGGLKSIEGPLQDLFAEFAALFHGTSLQLLSGLADGADQAASEIFIRQAGSLERGMGERLLGAVLPFSAEKYLCTIEDRACFRKLYGECSYRLQLDGAGITDRDGNVSYKEAYRQQARILPRLCDIFIAVASKNKHGSMGGTKEAVQAALLLNKPVIFLNLDDLQFYFYRNMEEWVFSLKPPESLTQVAKACSSLFMKEVSDPFEEQKHDLFYYARRWMSACYEWFYKYKEPIKPNRESKRMSDETVFQIIEGQRRKISEVSKYFMFQYRGGYLLNYCLAILAIFVAVNTSTVHLVEKELDLINEHLAKYTLLVLGLLKAGIIVLIIWNTKKINRQHYNAKAIKYRYAAERLRVASYFSLFGILKIPNPFVGFHVNTHLRTYPGEAIFRKKMSQITIQHGMMMEIDRQYLLETCQFIRESWLTGQLSYYEKESAKMKRIDESLIAIPEKLSVIVLAIVIAEIFEVLFSRYLHGPISTVILWAVPVMVGATILLPGIVTTVNSIHFQSEAKRLAFRNDIMTNNVAQVIRRLEDEETRIARGSDGNNVLRVLSILDEAAAMTTDEVAEWTMIYEKSVPDPG